MKLSKLNTSLIYNFDANKTFKNFNEEKMIFFHKIGKIVTSVRLTKHKQNTKHNPKK